MNKKKKEGCVIINNNITNNIGSINGDNNIIQAGINNTNNIKTDNELKNITEKLIAEILKAQDRNTEINEAIETIKEIAKNPRKESKSKLKMVCSGLNTILGTLSNASSVLPKLEAFKDYIENMLS